MLDHFQIDQSLSEESFFDDVVGEESSLIETNSTHTNKQGQEEKITLIKGDHQTLEFVESLVELGDDETEMPKEADVMLENGPMDKPDDHALPQEEVTQETPFNENNPGEGPQAEQKVTKDPTESSTES